MTMDLLQAGLLWGSILEDLDAEVIVTDESEVEWHDRAALASIEHSRVSLEQEVLDWLDGGE